MCVQTQIEAVRVAQQHYPERLGLAVVANPPRLFWVLWKALQPILDPVTKCATRFLCLVCTAGTGHVVPALKSS